MPEIRPATLEDASEIARLGVQLGYEMSESPTRERLAYIVSSPDHEILVCADSGGLIGWIGLQVVHGIAAGTYAELSGLVVDELFRSKGIGGRLLSAGESWSAERGFRSLRVQTNTIRLDAHRFYERLGYRRVKEQRVY